MHKLRDVICCLDDRLPPSGGTGVQLQHLTILGSRAGSHDTDDYYDADVEDDVSDSHVDFLQGPRCDLNDHQAVEHIWRAPWRRW